MALDLGPLKYYQRDGLPLDTVVSNLSGASGATLVYKMDYTNAGSFAGIAFEHSPNSNGNFGFWTSPASEGNPANFAQLLIRTVPDGYIIGYYPKPTSGIHTYVWLIDFTAGNLQPFKLYIDGTQQTISYIRADGHSGNPTNDTIYVGARSGNIVPLVGGVTIPKLYNYQFSEAEVQAVTAPSANISARYGTAKFGMSKYGVIVNQASTQYDFTPTATVRGTTRLSGSTTATFNSTASISQTVRIQGSGSYSFNASADIDAAIQVSGSTNYSFLTTGSLSAGYSGSSNYEFSAQGNLVARGSLKGTTTFFYEAGATTTATRYGSGTAEYSFNSSGTLVGFGSLSGAIPYSFETQGSLTLYALGVGNSTYTFLPTVSLRGRGRILGSTTSVFTTNANPTYNRKSSGSTSFEFGSEALISGSTSLSGTTLSEFFSQGNLIGASAIFGSTSFAFTQTGLLKGSANLGGVSDLIFDASGTLIGFAPISGSSSFVYNTAGVLNRVRLRPKAITVTFSVKAKDLKYKTSLAWFNTYGPNRLPYDIVQKPRGIIYEETTGTNRLPYILTTRGN